MTPARRSSEGWSPSLYPQHETADPHATANCSADSRNPTNMDHGLPRGDGDPK